MSSTALKICACRYAKLGIGVTMPMRVGVWDIAGTTLNRQNMTLISTLEYELGTLVLITVNESLWRMIPRHIESMICHLISTCSVDRGLLTRLKESVTMDTNLKKQWKDVT